MVECCACDEVVEYMGVDKKKFWGVLKSYTLQKLSVVDCDSNEQVID